MLGRAILYTIVTALLVADQTWMGFGTAVPQLIVGGVNILVVIAAFLHALQTNPINGKFRGFFPDDSIPGGGSGASGSTGSPSSGTSPRSPVNFRTRLRMSHARRSLVPALALFIGLLAAATEVSCTKAQQAETDQVVNTVLADLNAGDGLQQIETDVSAIVCPSGTASQFICGLAIVAVNDAINFLLDMNQMPASSVVLATAYHASLATVLASPDFTASKKALSVRQ
jgi:hypothetical protein